MPTLTRPTSAKRKARRQSQRAQQARLERARQLSCFYIDDFNRAAAEGKDTTLPRLIGQVLWHLAMSRPIEEFQPAGLGEVDSKTITSLQKLISVWLDTTWGDPEEVYEACVSSV